jgi:hypothetical protein
LNQTAHHILNENLDLYNPSRESYLRSLEYAKNLKNSDNRKLVFHCLWREPKKFGRKQLAVLKSLVVNNLEAVDSLEINLWSNVDLSDNPYFKQVKEYVNLRNWNLHNEIKQTILEDHKFLSDTNNVYDDLCYLEGDLFRLLILHKYGGFYIDMDVLILRNLLPLNGFEFLYQWGTSGFRGETFRMNGAIMRLEQNSDISLELLKILKETPAIKNHNSWGTELYSKLKRNSILALPGMWFDSEWGFEGTSLNPFKNTGKVELYEGAFAWHWHNRFDEDIEKGSKYDIIESKHEQIFTSMQLWS